MSVKENNCVVLYSAVKKHVPFFICVKLILLIPKEILSKYNMPFSFIPRKKLPQPDPSRDYCQICWIKNTSYYKQRNKELQDFSRTSKTDKKQTNKHVSLERFTKAFLRLWDSCKPQWEPLPTNGDKFKQWWTFPVVGQPTKITHKSS